MQAGTADPVLQLRTFTEDEKLSGVKPSVRSLLDNDFYKLIVQQAAVERFPDVVVTYSLIDRSVRRRYPKDYVAQLREDLWSFADLQVGPDELRWLRGTRLFSDGYLEFLSNYSLDPGDVEVDADASGRLKINIEGSWKDTVLWEIPLLSWINESYYSSVESGWDANPGSYYLKTLNKGMELVDLGAHFFDFGTSRRRSAMIHEIVMRALKAADRDGATRKGSFLGSSNLHFCRLHGLEPVGMMPHEWIMVHEALFGLEEATPSALHSWLEASSANRLDSAVADTFTHNLFFAQFTAELSRRYRALRHDSGDPGEFIERALQHYVESGVDPHTKCLVFSDGIDRDKIGRILNLTAGRIEVCFGIGSWLTNDFPEAGPGPVIKMTRANGIPTVKTSSEAAKSTGDPAKVRSILRQISRLESYQ